MYMSQSFMHRLADRLLVDESWGRDWVLNFTFNAKCYASDRSFRMYTRPEAAFLTTEIEEAGIGFMWGWKNLDMDSINFWFKLKGLY